MYWLIGSFIMFLVIMIFYFKRLKLICNITYTKDKYLILQFVLTIFKISIYKKFMKFKLDNSKELEEILLNERIDKQKVKQFINKFFQLNNYMTVLLKNIKILNFKWQTTIGTGEASSTGIICGGIWMLKSQIIGLISNQSKLCAKPEITVTPRFNIREAESEVACIGLIGVGQAINIIYQGK